MAFHTADTTVFAFLANNCALFVIGTGNNRFFRKRNDGNQFVGASLYAHAAGSAFSCINVGNAVFHADCIVLAGLCTVAAAKAAGGAGALAAVKHFCGCTGFKTVVNLFLCIVKAIAVAMNKGCHGFAFENLNAHNVRNRFCNGSAAGAAKVSRNGRILGDGLCIGVTAGISAGTAVGAGKAVADGNFFFVDLNAHKGGGN